MQYPKDETYLHNFLRYLNLKSKIRISNLIDTSFCFKTKGRKRKRYIISLTYQGSWGLKYKHWRRQWRWWGTGPSCTKNCRKARTVARNRWRWTVCKGWRTRDRPRPGWWSRCSWSISWSDWPLPRSPPTNSRPVPIYLSCRKILERPPPLSSPLGRDRSCNRTPRCTSAFRCYSSSSRRWSDFWSPSPKWSPSLEASCNRADL